MFLKASGALACVLALTAIPAFANGSPGHAPEKSKHSKVCKLLPPSAQPKAAPVASRRVHGDRGVSGSVMVVIPATTCNTNS